MENDDQITISYIIRQASKCGQSATPRKQIEAYQNEFQKKMYSKILDLQIKIENGVQNTYENIEE